MNYGESLAWCALALILLVIHVWLSMKIARPFGLWLIREIDSLLEKVRRG